MPEMALADDSVLLTDVPLPLRMRLSPLVVAALALALLAAASLPIDLALASICRNGDMPGDLARIVHLSEAFAHGAGVALILLTAWTLDRVNGRRLARVAASAYGAGLLANLGKLVLARSRPNGFGEGVSVFDSFHAWLPFLSGRMERWSDGVQSFPSAHAATAVGFGLALASVYPRGRWLFLLFASLAAFQRISAGAHFLSDTLAGAAIGCLGAALFLPGGWAAGWFDSFERSPPAHRIASCTTKR
jgi:membrane-associated phospholipid phosphatase